MIQTIELKPLTQIIKEPNYNITTGGFNICNYSPQYFFPKPALRDGLERVLIFTETESKHDIPNGSVWTYRSDAYRPDILRADVGCGIATFITEDIIPSPDFATAVVNAVDSMGTNVGRGNHFISFNTKHPLLKQGNMLFIHSDFNPDNAMPRSYGSAIERMALARDARRDLGERLLKRLGLSGEFYNDWMHNKVSSRDGKMIYQKGSIDVNETENEGLLGISPTAGLYFYVSEWKDFNGMMQHGTGRIPGSRMDWDESRMIQIGKVRGFLLNGKMKSEAYHSNDLFREKFILSQLPLGYSVPYLCVKTS
jgi:hypothetical protein